MTFTKEPEDLCMTQTLGTQFCNVLNSVTLDQESSSCQRAISSNTWKSGNVLIDYKLSTCYHIEWNLYLATHVRCKNKFQS